jgi:hypothetical protein
VRKGLPGNLGEPERLRREAVRASEGNEVRSEGRRAVGVSHWTDEAGELTRRTPWRKGGTGVWNRSEERWERHRARKLSQRNSNG